MNPTNQPVPFVGSPATKQPVPFVGRAATNQPVPFVGIDVTKAHVVATLPHPRQLASARISPCGKFVAAAGLDEKVHITSLDGGARRSLEGHQAWVVAMGFLPDGRLVTADQHGTLIAWDAALERKLWTSTSPGRAFLRCLAVGTSILTGGDDGLLRLRNPADGKIQKEWKGHESAVYAAAFHPDGSFVTGDLQGEIRHWESGALKRKLDAKPLHTRGEDFLADVGGVRSFAFSADGLRLAAGGMKDAKSNTFCPGSPTVLVFDWATGERKAVLETTGSADGPVNAVRYLPDGLLCGISESHGGNAGLYFWKDGPKPLHIAEAPSAYDLDVHPDGRRVALACFATKGSGGNGRAAKTRAEYVPNEGAIRLYGLFEKPKPEPKRKGT